MQVRIKNTPNVTNFQYLKTDLAKVSLLKFMDQCLQVRKSDNEKTGIQASTSYTRTTCF